MSSRPWSDDGERETDARFPSGRWTGYWIQGRRRGRMQLNLTFGGGRLFGEGRDAVGDFVFSGSYDRDSGGCWMHKAYLGQHGVEYDGRATAAGIRGTWRIAGAADAEEYASGPFHIWPIAAEEGDALAAEAVLSQPA